eukprot:scaffold80697_cov21-Tisochrysis_lutea.AAC.1
MQRLLVYLMAPPRGKHAASLCTPQVALCTRGVNALARTQSRLSQPCTSSHTAAQSLDNDV